jgi:hypothetical protein
MHYRWGSVEVQRWLDLSDYSMRYGISDQEVPYRRNGRPDLEKLIRLIDPTQRRHTARLVCS